MTMSFLFIAVIVIFILYFLRGRKIISPSPYFSEFLTTFSVLVVGVIAIYFLMSAISTTYINIIELDHDLPGYSEPTKADAYYFAAQTLTTVGYGARVHAFENCSPGTVDKLKSHVTPWMFVSTLVWGLLIAVFAELYRRWVRVLKQESSRHGS